MLFYLKIFVIPILLSLCTLIVAIGGDRIGYVSYNKLLIAVSDSLTHGVIGLLSWTMVVIILNNGFRNYLWDIVMCGICSSAIDIDHFIAARSLVLQDALNLTSRPFLHCSTIPIIVCGAAIVVAYLLHLFWLQKWSWLLLAAFSTHHVRDATRRGLWFWPVGSTSPLPYYLYIFILLIIPYLLVFFMRLSSFNDGFHRFQSVVIV